MAGFLHSSTPLDSVGWHGDSWVTEQACIARGSLRLTPLACLEMLSPLGVRQADGLLRARHGVDLLADEEIQGRVYSPQCPARTPRPLVPASPSASQPPVLKLRGLAASLPYRAASNIHGAGIFAKLTFACGLISGPPSIGGHRSPRSRICNSSSLLSIASVSTLPCSSRWRGKAAFLLRRFRVAGRTCIPRQRLGLVLFTVH